MNVRRLLQAELRNIVRSRWFIVYALLLLGLTDLVFRFGGGGPRAVLSLTNVVLALVPLVALVFGTTHIYHARKFIELMLAQPIGRRPLYVALYGGLSLPLAGAYAAGVGLPMIWHHGLSGGAAAGLILVAAGIALTFVFTAIAFALALWFEERATGLGAAIITWLLTVVVYDGLLLLTLVSMGDWPSETPALVATMLNPVDLGRVLLLLQFDLAALSGYTGAVFEKFFSGNTALLVASLALLAWIAAPLWFGLRRFERRDW